MVVQRGVNEQEIVPMIRWSHDSGVILRFIEFMDVGETNGWNTQEVVTAKEILEIVREQYPVKEVSAAYPGEVARRWRFLDGAGEFGTISSVSQPFCGDCSRLRVSAEGKAFTCLFASQGANLRDCLRAAASDEDVTEFVRNLWTSRKDRYSEKRGEVGMPKAEMSYLGG
jgi:cyclic pyranopterin phosphate synthase